MRKKLVRNSVIIWYGVRMRMAGNKHTFGMGILKTMKERKKQIVTLKECWSWQSIYPILISIDAKKSIVPLILLSFTGFQSAFLRKNLKRRRILLSVVEYSIYQWLQVLFTHNKHAQIQNLVPIHLSRARCTQTHTHCCCTWLPDIQRYNLSKCIGRRVVVSTPLCNTHLKPGQYETGKPDRTQINGAKERSGRTEVVVSMCVKPYTAPTKNQHCVCWSASSLYASYKHTHIYTRGAICQLFFAARFGRVCKNAFTEKKMSKVQ